MKNIFLLLTLALLWTGCASEDITTPEAKVNVSNPNISLDHSNSYELSFSSTYSWTISLSDTSKTGWCNVFPLSGKGGDVKIAITALPNTSDDRAVTLTLKSGNVEKTIEIFQQIGCGVNDITIPDKVFRKYCLEYYDTDGNGMVAASEVEKVIKLQLNDSYNWREINDFQGIEYFKELKDFSISSYYITDLDISKNKNLEKLFIGSNGLSALDLTNNKKLKRLEGRFNFNNIDLSKNTQLEYLSLKDGSLTSLNLSNNPNLKNLNCNYNKIKELDLSNNTILETISCSDNMLEKLITGSLPNLTILYCQDNNLSTLNLNEYPNLKNLSCEDNKLTSLGFNKNINLENIDCDDNQLTSLDVSKCLKLKELRCSNNKLTLLDLTQNLLLENIYCYSYYSDNTLLAEIWLNKTLQNKYSVYISKDYSTKVIYK